MLPLGGGADLADAVRSCLAQLTEVQRAAIDIACYGGASYREAARSLGITEGAAKWHIRSGLQQLRGLLVAAGWAPVAAE